MKTFLTHLLIAAIAAGTTWYLLSQKAGHSAPQPEVGARKLLYYQSPMHPWVKSEEPGRCTVCGMALVPVYEGDGGFDDEAQGAGIIMLPAGSPNVVGVQTAKAKIQPLTRTLRVAGMIDDDESRHRVLSAYTRGRVEKLFVNYEGAEVHAGEPLALFYSQDLLSAARDHTLAARQGSASLTQATSTRLLQLGLTKEQIQKIPSRAENDLFFEILAPMNGTVVKRNVYEGQYVEEGAPLFELADFSTMWFQFIAYEQDLPFLKVGQKVQITTPSVPGKVIESKITFINPNLDEMSRSARVRVEIENPATPEGLHRGHEILHKLYAEAIVHIDAPEVLSVPRQAVLWSGKQPRVYVEKGDSTYEQRIVKLGRLGDTHWEITDGLAAGDLVVLTGNMLIDGQAQLDAMVTGGGATPAPSDRPLAATERESIVAYFKAADAINVALANDDLAAANAALNQLPPAPAGLITANPPSQGTDLKQLRQAFLPWSEELAAVAIKLKDQVPELRVFRCPMTNDLWSGAPANAKWIQLTADLRNPYWGHEMRDCGAELRP